MRFAQIYWVLRNDHAEAVAGNVTIKMRLMHCERIEPLIFAMVNAFKKAHY